MLKPAATTRKRHANRKRLIPRKVAELAGTLGIPIRPWTMDEIRWLECGLHSGFPPCCVSFWVKVLSPACDEPDDTLGATICDSYFAAFDIAQEAHGDVGIGYRPCYACLFARKFVKVLRCDCGTKLQRGQLYPWLHQVEPGCVLVDRDGMPRMSCSEPK